jgi:hypothetical protein
VGLAVLKAVTSDAGRTWTAMAGGADSAGGGGAGGVGVED